MQKALLNSQVLDLRELPREQYQILYESGIHGKLTCGCCGEQVKLYLGIHHSPHFYHHSKSSTTSCSDYMESLKGPNPILIEDEPQYIEQNGFMIPKSRAIQSTATIEKTTNWKAPKAIKKLSPFEMPEQLKQDSKLLNLSLDTSQYHAVTANDGPLLIVAGAGSGKTRVLTSRTAYLIKERNIDPKQIMLVTFTTKAASEMKERLIKYAGLTNQQINSLVTGTFHSIFYKIITFHEPNRWRRNNLLKWDYQKEQIIKEAARELALDEKEFAFDQALQLIGFWKNTLLPPDLVKPKDQWEERVLYMYRHYEKKKLEHQLFDFDDMLVGCYYLFKEQPDILTRYQERFSHFLIDEFQDINKVQYETIKLLSESTRNLCVVGDDDQSIYAFRGSDPTFMLDFEKDYPTAKIVTLSQNYRSTHSIVATAHKVVTRNQRRREKIISASFDNTTTPLLFFPFDEEEEATMIVTDIKEKIKNGANPTDFAILYRTHTAARAIFERLSQSNLPFKMEQDSDSFYNRRTVRGLLAYLHLSIDPNDTKAIGSVLSSLFLKQNVLNDLKAFSILDDCSLVEALEKLTTIHPFQQKKLQKIVPLFARLKNLSPLSAIEMIEKDMGFGEYMKKNGNEGNTIERGSDDIRDLKVVAKKFKEVNDLLEHVDHMNAMNIEMKQLSKHYTDAIQLLTIHRSKGLEYKHVYLLGTVDGSIPHDFALDSLRNGDRDSLEEERRLLYVAMTRAEHSLTLSVPEMRRNKLAQPSRFIKEFL
ncbi:UvrD-helicase domain-containing protein [Bacillus sp. PS06]|uniref:UvrD-helicase domain-containing protein n=1 Tax=Bacillus sp. PS06 TaxID=2764176 RepID=UPI001787205A|nr:ATP-dependent helicase [Bacillus sp. PS06]MBD8067486.1 ATP-dependent helicase [Bacillus sp. PS06]